MSRPEPDPFPLRRIRVVSVRSVTQRVLRVTFGGEALAGLALAGPDQQVKLYFPRPRQSEPVLPAPDPDGDIMRWYTAYGAIPEAERPWMRSYTIRAHDPAAGTVDIDFYLHGGDGRAHVDAVRRATLPSGKPYAWPRERLKAAGGGDGDGGAA
ncbi:siderophore-interacting protein [Streptomyces sp. NPDC046237]|uniref:siderophore-interacting protein n=1 Tax=Streptomyces sp. NPDC046237 TaxID=3154914 RepID=UPI0033E55C16